jgi:tRNA-splicing ligase RtcB
MERSFGTTCHGAGRRMSRTGARKQIAGAELRHQLDRSRASRASSAVHPLATRSCGAINIGAVGLANNHAPSSRTGGQT